ncbi:hypothetical protein Gorai_024656, partial [Gossypium raimondii]|nr:hypothetical protein [Gossypium raimondii]
MWRNPVEGFWIKSSSSWAILKLLLLMPNVVGCS